MDETATADRPVSERVGALLRDSDGTIATSESCTAGLIASRLVSVPGASDYVEGGLVSYGYDTKRTLAGVSREALDAEGAVSERVAREMAAGVRDRLDTTWGVATTGVVGPGDGDAVPAGTVWIGVAHAAPWGTDDSYRTARRYTFEGDRNEVRAAIANRALSDVEAAIRDTVGSDPDSSPPGQ